MPTPPTMRDTRILEGIVTTIDEDGSVHIAPMGPRVDENVSQILLRPYRTSTTYRNLVRTRQGILHVTDDVELLARAAVGGLEHEPATEPAEAVEGRILTDACHWIAFRVQWIGGQDERAEVHAERIDRGFLREFFGFNRAKHAVVEAAILATRLKWLPADSVLEQLDYLADLVEKTSGDQERRAFEFLRNYVRRELGGEAPPSQ